MKPRGRRALHVVRSWTSCDPGTAAIEAATARVRLSPETLDEEAHSLLSLGAVDAIGALRWVASVLARRR